MIVERIGKIVALIGATLAVAGCHHTEAPKPSTGPVALKVGYLPIADCLQLYVAKEKGLFDKQGLSVELVALQSGPKVIEAMTGKSIDAGVSNVVSTMIAHTKGVPVVAITGGPLETDTHSSHALLVSADSTIKQATDLSGKTVAVNGLRNIEHVMLRQYLEKHGIPVDKVRVVEIPFPQMEGVLKNHSVDAVTSIEPFITLAESHHSVRVLGRTYIEVHPKNIVSSYDVMSDWLKRNPDAAHKFATAIAEATDYISKNDSEVRQILLKYTKTPESIVNQIVLPEFQGKYAPTELQPWVDELARQGIINKPFPAGEVFQQQ